MRVQYTSGSKFEDAENYDDILKRVDKILEHLENRDEQSIMAVAHGFIIKAIIARVVAGEALNEDFFKHFHHHVYVENTGLSVLQYRDAFEEDHKWRLWIFNDHAHLAD
jgi:broad specificity phosphatase PhoE